MGVYHTATVGALLQDVAGVKVRAITDSSWSFDYEDARVNLRVLPGCCGVLLVYNISGDQKHVNRLLKKIVPVAGKAQFGLVLMSLRKDSALRKLLSTDWQVYGFKNPRTRNEIDLLFCPTKAKEKPKPAAPAEDQ